MNRFRLHFSSAAGLLSPLHRFLLGACVCAVALANDGLPSPVQATPTVPSTRSSLHFEMSIKHRPAVSYALIQAHDMAVFVGASAELRQVDRQRKRRPGEFLWIRQGDSEYVLDDPVAVAELLQRWQTLQAPEQQMAALEQQLRPHTEQLEAQADELEDAIDDWAERVDHQKVAQLHEQMEALHAKIEPISAQMEALGQQIETLADDVHQFTLQRIEAAEQSGKLKLVPVR